MKVLYIIIIIIICLVILLINNIIGNNNIENYEDNIIIREDIYTNNYKEIDILNYEDIYINYYKITPILFKIKNTITKELFFKNIENFEFGYSVSGNNDINIGKITCQDYLKFKNDEYIFHSIFRNDDRETMIKKEENNKLIKILTYLIPLPSTKSMNLLSRCDLYFGNKYTGTHLHNHLEAINYLIYGKKIWVILPNSNDNNLYLESIKFDYPNKFNETPLQWLNKYYDGLKKHIKNLYIFIQKTGESVYIPKKYYHLVINLEDSCGYTYNFV
jgi:hypothetical protein